MPTNPIPSGYHTVTPHLIVHDAARAIAFYQQAFGATEVMRIPGPGGKLMHAQLQIGDARIMLADEMPEMGARGPQALGGSPVSFYLHVADVDATARQAVAAGAKVLKPVQDQFYGDRAGTFTDPFGHVWTIATHKEDVSMEEMKRRFEAMRAQPAGA